MALFEEQTKYTVEQGYKIGLIFFLRFWDLLEPEVKKLPGNNTLLMHDLFFRDVCLGYEASGEWIESVFLTTHATREEQKRLLISEAELFVCTVEFCKLYDKRWRHILTYTVQRLESMQEHPEQHMLEWSIWEKAKSDILNQRVKFYGIDWTAYLPDAQT